VKLGIALGARLEGGAQTRMLGARRPPARHRTRSATSPARDLDARIPRCDAGLSWIAASWRAIERQRAPRRDAVR